MHKVNGSSCRQNSGSGYGLVNTVVVVVGTSYCDKKNSQMTGIVILRLRAAVCLSFCLAFVH